MQGDAVDSYSFDEVMDKNSIHKVNTQQNHSDSMKHLEDLRITNYCLTCFNCCKLGRCFALEEITENNYHYLAKTSDLEGSQAASLRDKFGLALILLHALQLIAIVRETRIFD